MSYVRENGNRKLGKLRGAITGRLGEVLDYGTSGTVTTSPGQANADDVRTAYLVRQMHALATSVYQAKQRNDKETVASLLQHFQALADEYRNLGPIGVNPFDKFIIETGDWLKGVASTVALKGLLPLAVLGVGFLYLKKKLF